MRTILGGKVNTRRIPQPDMESIFTKIIKELFWSDETIMWIIKIIKIKCFNPPQILNEHWRCIFSCQSIKKYSGHRELLCEISKLSKLNGMSLSSNISYIVLFNFKSGGFCVLIKFSRCIFQAKNVYSYWKL